MSVWSLRLLAALLLFPTVGCGDDTPASEVTDALDADLDASPADTPDSPDSPDQIDSFDTDLAETSPDTEPDLLTDTADDVPDVADTPDLSDTTEPVDTADTSLDTDTGPTLPLAGFGLITGPCGFIDDELYDPNPTFVVNAIDFTTDPYDASDFDLLTDGGQEIIRDGNAGGNSLYSEVFAFEVLDRCELASLIATETEIVYDVQGKITDILVEIDGERVGVSVVRAVGFPKDAPYTVEQARTILRRKLEDIQVSSANVSADYRWVKQILSVMAYGDQHVESLMAAWEGLPASTRADTIVLVTVTHGDDAFMY